MRTAKPTYEELERRLVSAEGMLRAIRSGQTDTILGDRGSLVLRLAEAEARAAHIKQVLLAIRNVNQLIVHETDRARLIQKTCENLTETLGYHNAWIALLDQPQSAVTMASSSGFEDGFSSMRDLFGRGELPACIRKSVGEGHIAVVEDPSADCPGCPYAGTYGDRSGLIGSLAFADKTFGVLVVSVPAAYANDEEDQSLFAELVGDVSFALHKIEMEERRQKTEQRLKESEELLRETGRMARVGGWELDAETMEVTWTEETYHIHEIPLSYKPPLEEAINFFHEDDRETLKQAIEKAIEFGHPYDMELRFRSATGTSLWTHIACKPDVVNGKTIRLRGTLQDITERKQAQEAIRESERFLHATLDALSAHIAILDEAGTIVAVNESWRRFAGDNDAGLGRRDGVNQNYLAVCDSAKGDWSDGASTVAQMIRDMIKGESEGFVREYPCHSPSEKRWFVLRATRFLLGGQVRVVLAHENITARKESEEALRASEQRFRIMFDRAPVGIALVDLDHHLLAANKSYCALLARTEDEVRQLKLSDFTHPDDLDENLRLQHELGMGRIPSFLLEKRFIQKDGTISTGLLVASLVTSEAGAPLYYLGMVLDITDHRKAEEALRASEELYRSLFEKAKRQEQLYLSLLDCSADPIVVYDLEGKVRYLNAAHTNLFGWTMEEALGKRLNTVPESDQGVTFSTINHIVTEGLTTRTYDTQRLTKEGRLVDVSVSGARYLDHEGKSAGMVVILRDITEKRKAEEELRESEEKYRRIVETANEGIWEMDGQFRTIFVNQRMAEMLGFKTEEMLGKSVESFMFDEDLTDHNKKMQSRREGQNQVYERRFRRKDGTGVWMTVAATALKDSEGKFAGSFAMFTDITERRQSEEALRLSEERFSLAMDATQDALWDRDMTTGAVFRSERFYEMLGVGSDSFSGQVGDWHHLVLPEDYANVRKGLEEYLTGHREKHEVEFRVQKPSGDVVWILSRGQVVSRSELGKPLRMVGTHSDVTDRKRADAALRESTERLHLYAKATNDVIWDWDVVNDKQFWNKSGTVEFGWEDIVNSPQTASWWIDRIHPDDRERVSKGFYAAIQDASGSHWADEYRFRKADGTYAEVLDRGYVIYDERGRALRMVGAKLNITERKRAELELRQINRRLEESQRIAKIGTWEWSPVTGDTYWSDETYRLFGLEPGSEVPSYELAKRLTHPEDIQEWQGAVEKALAGEERFVHDYRAVRTDGKVIWISNEAEINRDEQGNVSQVLGTAQNVTERKRAEQALRESEERYRQITECSLTGIFIHQDGKGVFVNQRLADMLGYSKEEMTGRDFLDAIHPLDREMVLERVTARLKGMQPPESYELRLLKKTGEELWCEVLATVIDYKGRPSIMGNLADITERKESEKLLRQKVEALRLSEILASVGYFERNWQTGEGYWSEGFFRILGEDLGTVLSHEEFLEYVHEDDRERVARHISQTIQQHEPMDIEFRIVSGKGTVKDIHGIAETEYDEYEKPWTTRGTFQEITERKRAQEALRSSEERYQAVFNNARMGIGVIAPDGRFLQVNPALEEMLGYSEADLLNFTVLDVTHPEDISISDNTQNGMIKGKTVPYRIEKRFVRKDGTVIWGDVWGSPMAGPDGTPMGIVETIADITARRITEKALRESEENFRSFFDALDDLVLVATPDGRCVFVNNAATRKLGYNKDDLCGRHILELHPVEQRKRAEIIFEQMLKGERDTCPLEIETKNGDLVPVENRIAFGRWDGEDCVFGVCKDLSKERAALERFTRVFNNNPALMAMSRIPGRVFTQVNDRFLEVLGYSKDEILGNTAQEIGLFVQSETASVITASIQGGGRVHNVEVQVRKKDGTVVDGLFSGEVIQSLGEKSFLSIMLDVSEAKQSQEALRQSEARYRGIFENAAIGIDVVDGDGRFLQVNGAMAAMLGYSEEELLNLTILDVTHPDDVAPSEVKHMQMVRGETGSYRLQKRYIKKTGEFIWADVTASPVLGPDGRHVATVGVVSDITDRVNALQALRESEERYRAVVNNLHIGISVINRNMEIVAINPFFAAFFPNVRPGSGEVCYAAYNDPPSSEPCSYCPCVLTFQDGKVHEAETDTPSGGQIRHFRIVSCPVKDQRGEVELVIELVEDVTERRSLYAQLAQAQKMEAVGTLAGGVAHDFNNILQVALGFSEIMLEDENLPNHYRSDVNKIHDSAKRGADLVQRLLTFSRKTEIKRQPMDLNSQIHELRKMLERTIPKMVDIKLILDAKLAKINGDKTQIDQILMNLSVNARDAMPDGGELVIETQNVTLDDDYALTHAGAKPGTYVMLSVSDTGQGIDNETRQHIFEPFFTTKGVGQGTGLGLAMVYGIVKQHDGYITCESEPGLGTTFKMYFPAIIADATTRETSVREMPRGGSETILLVDDEELIRDLGSRILTKAGYRVLTASNGEEALEIYEKSGNEIALVLLDLIMPEMGGKQCLERLLVLDSSVKVVIASGYAASGPTKDAVEAAAKGFVKKPYDMKQVLAVVREVLDAE